MEELGERSEEEDEKQKTLDFIKKTKIQDIAPHN